jgi:hypothetical protein
VLAAQVLALTLNVEYSCAGVFASLGLNPASFCYGNTLVPEGCGKFGGMTVDEFLMLANKVVAGKLNVLNGYDATISDVNYTATCLNEQYSDCDPYAPTVSVARPDTEAPAVISKDGAVVDLNPALPTEFNLAQNHPNPFNPMTRVTFSLPQASHVRLVIYNILGQPIATLVNGNREAGYHTVIWNASDAASGIYFYRIEADGFADTKKMVLLK